MSRFNAVQQDAIKRALRPLLDSGVNLDPVQLFDDIFDAIAAGSIGITAPAANVDALALDNTLFGQDTDTTTGLTLGYKAGFFYNGSVLVAVAAGTIALSASNTNYVEVSPTGVVSKNTVGFTAGSIPLYLVTTGSSSISVVTNKKPLLSCYGSGLIAGQQLSTAAATKELHVNLGAISATASFAIVLPQVPGTIGRITFVGQTSVAASDTDYWTFGVVNKGTAGSGTAVVVDNTSAANSTKATGGTALTANVPRSLTLTGVGADLIHAAGDVLLLTVTKAGSATTISGAAARADSIFTG